MPFDRAAPEASREAIHELAGEGDLRQHDEGLAAALQRPRHGFEIHLGLARPGDAVEQRHGECAFRSRTHDLDRLRLRSGEVGRSVGGVGSGQALFRNRHFHQHARLDQSVDHACRASRLERQRALGADEAIAGNLDRARPGRRHARGCRRVGVHLYAEARFGGLEHGRGAHHHADQHAQRRQGVARHPFRKAERDLRQRGDFGQGSGDGLELLLRDRLARIADRGVPDHADAALRPERDQYEVAGRRHNVGGQRIVVGLIERYGQDYGHGRALIPNYEPAFLELCEQTFQTGPRTNTPNRRDLPYKGA